MLRLDLQGMMRRREIQNPYRFLVQNGFNYHTAGRLLHNERDSIPYKHLEKLCLLFQCTPNDLLVWQKPKDVLVSGDHPLHQLKPKKNEVNILKKLEQLPLDKLEEVKTYFKDLP